MGSEEDIFSKTQKHEKKKHSDPLDRFVFLCFSTAC